MPGGGIGSTQRSLGKLGDEFLTKWDRMYLKIIARQGKMGLNWDKDFFIVTAKEIDEMMEVLTQEPVMVQNILGQKVAAKKLVCKRKLCKKEFLSIGTNVKFCSKECQYTYHKHRVMEIRKLYTRIRKEAKASGNPYSIDVADVLKRVDRLLENI